MKIPIFFRPEMSCSVNSSYSPSADKPKKAVADWFSRPSIAASIAIQSFEPITEQTLYEAHSPQHVRRVMACEEANGFGNQIPEVAHSLLYTIGSLVAACEHVLKHGGVAVSPTSGFHHAGYAFSEGFCTFNGLAVAAITAHNANLAKRVLILDFDAHQGNGTDDIIERLELDWITHVTASKSYETRHECMKIVHQIDDLLLEASPDLVIFQAGADMHVNDPLGAGLLDIRDMAIRDEKIMSACSRRKTPLVWNLAGGYQRDSKGSIEPVLAIHRQTMQACIETYNNGR